MQYHMHIYNDPGNGFLKGVDRRWKMSALKFVRDLVTVNHLICFRIFIPPGVYSGMVCFPANFLSFKSFLQKIFGCYDSLICRHELNQLFLVKILGTRLAFIYSALLEVQ